jgi:hypothetical protein
MRIYRNKRELGGIEEIDIEHGEYYPLWDSKGNVVEFVYNSKLAYYELVKVDTENDIKGLIQCIWDNYITPKASSQSFTYTGPENDPIELYTQFRKHNSMYAKLIRLLRNILGKK